METVVIPSSGLEFLKAIQDNNNREWFEQNKPWYKEEHARIKAFGNALLKELGKYDHLERVKLFRIYRDVRFSKNKSPYKTHWSGSVKRATALLRGGYYFHIQPGNSFIAGGFFSPESTDLRRIRDEISADADELREILAAKDFASYFGYLQGETVKTAPKGFSKEDPNIDLIRYKQFYVQHAFTDEEVLAEDFLLKVVEGFRHLRPFFDYMSDVLTTDANGELIVHE